MGCSRPPGVLNNFGPWAPARTPGPLGYNDQSDPNRCTLLGDTPGATGRADGADPTLPFHGLGTAPFIGSFVRLADAAFALATQAAAATLLRAPWMKFAEDEARQFKGQTEKEIQKVTNFQKEVDTGVDTMVGDDGEWCAAFVNWCLMKAGYEIENKGFYDHEYAKGRADAFRKVQQFKPDKNRKGDPKVRNPLYVEIPNAVFGAIGMVSHEDGRGHHVGFVYSQPDANTIVLLGGNQDDRIRFSAKNLAAVPAQTVMRAGKKVVIPAQKDHLAFYVPTGYEAYAKLDTQALSPKSADDLNTEFGIETGKAGKESTR